MKDVVGFSVYEWSFDRLKANAVSEVMIKAPSALAVQTCMDFIEHIPAADAWPDERFSC